jgi:hypothetical protein
MLAVFSACTFKKRQKSVHILKQTGVLVYVNNLDNLFGM